MCKYTRLVLDNSYKQGSLRWEVSKRTSILQLKMVGFLTINKTPKVSDIRV